MYSFDDLPPGYYTISASYGVAKVSRLRVALPRGAKFRSNFAIDPSDARERRISPTKFDGSGSVTPPLMMR